MGKSFVARLFLLLLLSFCISLQGQINSNMKKQDKKASPPVAAKRPIHLEKHGDIRVDSYYWLKEREDPEVIKYLEDENTYMEQSLSHTKGLQDKLFGEITSRIPQIDMSVPYLKNGYYYYTRYESGKEYPIYARKIDTLDAREQVLINVNEYAQGYNYYNIKQIAVDPFNKYMAYSEDTLSRRIYTIKVMDMVTGKFTGDILHENSGNIVWFNDGKAFLYVVKDPETLREYKVYRHLVGDDSRNDKLLYEEKDETFGVGIFKSRSNAFIYIGSYSTLTSEFRYCDANDSDAEFKLFELRKRDHLYSVADDGRHFYIVSNDKAINFRLFKTDLDKTERSNWLEMIPHRKDVLIEDVECFNDFIVVEERMKGMIRHRLISGEQDCYLDFDEDAYMTFLVDNHEFNTRKLRYSYTSLTTPLSVFDYDLDTKEHILLKEQQVTGGYDKSLYTSERIEVIARDGTRVPVSLVYKKSLKKKRNNPLLLYGYGSYGISIDPSFSSVRLSLLDRGFIYAIAHIRGGQELGRLWYEDGKLLKKNNTFSDFVDCGRYLVTRGYTSPEHLYAMGGSAGGLLMGAVINMSWDLFHGVIAAVPFVDVVTTMLDESIPLTTGEWDEWGNPNDKVYYDYIKSYSPYDNVGQHPYPSLLVTTGLHDSQVQYWEPAKWVAKLRDLKAGSEPVYLYTNMSTGHGGASGRFERYRETALEFAFLLDLEGIKD